MKDIDGKVLSGYHLLMYGELDPCRPDCMPKIRNFVAEKGVSTTYYASGSGKVFNWARESSNSVIRTISHNGNTIKRRYTNKNGKWRSKKNLSIQFNDSNS